jgi:excisionase family DNA binding protein
MVTAEGVFCALGSEREETEPMDTPPRDSRRHYESVANAAARVGVSTKTVRRWIASGQLAGYRVEARLLRVDPDDVDRILTPIPTASRRNGSNFPV